MLRWWVGYYADGVVTNERCLCVQVVDSCVIPA